MTSSARRTWIVLFWIYIALLFVFVVVKFDGHISRLTDRIRSISDGRAQGYWNINLVPFDTFKRYSGRLSEGFALYNIVGNTVPFIPMGFLIPAGLLKKPGFFKTMGLCLLIILGIETFQLFTMLGYFDVDDIWLNVCGCLFGFLCFVPVWLWRRHLQRKEAQNRSASRGEWLI